MQFHESQGTKRYLTELAQCNISKVAEQGGTSTATARTHIAFIGISLGHMDFPFCFELRKELFSTVVLPNLRMVHFVSAASRLCGTLGQYWGQTEAKLL